MTTAPPAAPLRFGIIGCGGIGPTHAGAIRQLADAALVAVADPLADRAAKLARECNVAQVYPDHAALVADPAVDAVCVCTPSGMHAEHAIAALEAGKHALVEKPMEITTAQCDRMIAAAAASGRQLGVISQHRFDSASELVKRAIDGGQLGKILLVEATVKWWRTQEYYDTAGWRGTWAFDGGGALMNQGIHTVDLLLWLGGDVTSLTAQTRTVAHARIEVEDLAVAMLNFENGALGTLLATTAAFPGFAVRLDIIGSAGTAVIEGDRLKTLTLKSGESYASEAAATHALAVAQGGTASVADAAAHRPADAPIGAVWGDAHRAQLADFMRAIRAGGKPLIDGAAGRKPVALIRAIYESARTGQPVSLG